MNLAFLASFIAFILFLTIAMRRQSKKTREMNDAFWEREKQANSVRRKSLDGLNYVKIPLETFPTHILQQDSTVQECIATLETLTSKKIVNLTGYTNTDLKLEYGTASITELSEYDSNYTALVRTLQKWADILLETGYMDEAAVLMEYAVSIGTDVGRSYYELARYYVANGKAERLDYLTAQADKLLSPHKKTILRRLKDFEKDPEL
jgi:hypothetical protein